MALADGSVDQTMPGFNVREAHGIRIALGPNLVGAAWARIQTQIPSTGALK
ncbi:hypothetical protein [Comamonas sp.]|uniref:hypothetical protein n=1 Tax=Comamonas sp. TaxID=34028 RepID=UPI0025C1B8C5|nr:hypothetical protein [Comamonas sp.]